jgi:hypothetical protein
VLQLALQWGPYIQIVESVIQITSL